MTEEQNVGEESKEELPEANGAPDLEAMEAQYLRSALVTIQQELSCTAFLLGALLGKVDVGPAYVKGAIRELEQACEFSRVSAAAEAEAFQAYPPSAQAFKRDPEEEALGEVLRTNGVNGLDAFGGGIFESGAYLQDREITQSQVLDHLKTRVKESYDKGYAEGREALLKEQLAEAKAVDKSEHPNA